MVEAEVTNSTPFYSADFKEDNPGADRGQAMLKASDNLDISGQEGFRQDWNFRITRMFESTPMNALYMYTGRYFGGSAVSYGTFSLEDQSTWNVMRSVAMTYSAMIGRSKPRARFLTNHGTYGQKRRARKATDFARGWASDAGLDAVMWEVLVDSAVTDLGVVQVCEENGKVCVQKVFASELRANPNDAIYGFPRTLYRRRFLSKDSLRAKAKQFARIMKKPVKEIIEAIMKAETIDPTGTAGQADQVRVEESYTLPTSADAKDGWHIIAIRGCTLVEEPWTKPYHPFVWLTFEKGRSGFLGISLCTQLEPIQIRINKMLYRWDRAAHLLTVPRIALQRGSKVIKTALTNMIAGAIEYTGNTPPQPLVWPIMPPEYYKMLEDQVQKAYDLIGISRDASSGVKEAGTHSGAAIRESLDIQTARIQPYMQQWEAAYIAVYKIAMDMVADVAERTGHYSVIAKDRFSMSVMDFVDLGIDLKDFACSIDPVSPLPMTPQGRLDFVTDMLEAGLWTPDRARQAMDDLDVNSAEDQELAPIRLLNKQFEDMLYDGKPAFPDEYTPYDQALRIGAQYMALAEEEEVPPKHRDLLSRYLEAAQRQNQRLKAAAAAPAGGGSQAQIAAPPPQGQLAPLSPLPPGLSAAQA